MAGRRPVESSVESSAPEPSTAGKAVGERIASVRGRQTQDDFAKELGVHAGTLGRYERGERLPDAEFLVALSSKRGISSDWVLFGLPPMSAAEAADQQLRTRALLARHSEGLARELQARDGADDLVLVNLYDVRVGGGKSAFAPEVERISAVRAFSRSWLWSRFKATDEDVYLVSVTGDSMAPLLNDGDVILVDKRDKNIRNDDVYVVRMDDALMVKNVQLLPGGIIKVWSENERTAEPFTVNIHQPELSPGFEILGRVVWRGGTLRR